MARRKYGTLELTRQELRELWKESFKNDKTIYRGAAYRDAIDDALKAIDIIEYEKWCLKDLDADQESWEADLLFRLTPHGAGRI